MCKKVMCLVSFVLVLLLMPTLCTAQQATPENLVLYLPCEDAQNPVDASLDPTTVEVIGTLTTAEGRFGTNGIVYPDWSGKQENRMSVATAPKLEGMPALTITAWVLPRNVAAHNGQMGIVSKRLGFGGSDEYNVFVHSGTVVHFRVNGNAGMALRGTTVIEDDNWYHVAATFDRGAVKLYIDGVLEDSGSHPSSSVVAGAPPAPVWIGLLDGDRNSFGWDGTVDEISIWTAALSEEDIARLMAKDIAEVVPDEQAKTPIPADGADELPIDSDLGWAPGNFADKHDVYIGTDFDDVNDAIATVDPAGVYVGRQSETAVALDRLEFGQTYYWRIDEVNAPPDLTVFKGDVWSFTVEPIGYPISNVVATADGSFEESVAERTVDGSGLTDDLHGTTPGDMWISTGIPATIQFDFDRVHKLHEMLIWNSNQTFESFVGFGAKDVVIEHSLDGENWTALDGVGPLAQAPGKVGYAANNQIAFGGATAQHVRLIINSAQGPSPQVSLSEVRFLSIPTLATGPDPESGAAGVAPDVTLSWGRDGREAELHDVYVGSDPDALALAGSIADSSFATAALDLQLGQTYSWRVDEVNNAMDPSIWTGDLWSFTTTDVLVIDDMEAYKDEEFKEIWGTWTDGFDDPANGALVGANPAGGDFSPETGIVSGGRQSLPIHFDNTGAPVSETTRTFDQAQDWTRFGITTLSLFVFAGDDNTGGDLYIKINDEKIALVDKSTYPAGLNPGWVRYNIDLTTRDVSSVSSLTMGVEGAAAQGVVYVDDIELYAQAPDLMILSFLAPTIEAESGTLSAPFEILSDRPEASGGQYIIVPNASGNSNGDPAARDDGWAVYTLNIPADGDYVIAFLGAELDSDSFWVNIPGMIVNDDSLDNSGWLRSNAIFNSSEFVWDFVRDDVGATTDPVVFTLTAGQHELQISRREDGTALDAIAIFSVN